MLLESFVQLFGDSVWCSKQKIDQVAIASDADSLQSWFLTFHKDYATKRAKSTTTYTILRNRNTKKCKVLKF